MALMFSFMLFSSLPRGGDPYLTYGFSIPPIRWYVKHKSQNFLKENLSEA
nr:MAG TPA: hypothetical protein [Caudoviricetes sp.]